FPVVVFGWYVFFSFLDNALHLHSFPTRRSSDLIPRTTLCWSHFGGPTTTGATRRWSSRKFDPRGGRPGGRSAYMTVSDFKAAQRDRKSTRLNSSHSQTSYAVFCLKKKTKK